MSGKKLWTLSGTEKRGYRCKTAGAIKDLLNTVVDTAKTQVAYIQSIPNTIKDQMSVNEVKAIAGTLVDRDAELDCSLAEIRQNQKQIYK